MDAVAAAVGNAALLLDVDVQQLTVQQLTSRSALIAAHQLPGQLPGRPVQAGQARQPMTTQDRLHGRPGLGRPGLANRGRDPVGPNPAGAPAGQDPRLAGC